MHPKLAEPADSRKVPLDAEKIPTFLKGIDRWVLWNAGVPAPNGKFSKFPVNKQGRKVNGLAPENWLSFKEAYAEYLAGKCVGIGLVLDGSPISCGDGQLFLIALDFDNCEPAATEIKKLWLKLGKPYVEVSPSGRGIRMFALSQCPLQGGNAGNGREMYSARRFMTVTGNGARGVICEATVPLQELHDEWFPKKQAVQEKRSTALLSRHLAYPVRPESPKAITRINEMLSFVSADCDYFTWRDIVWSVLSTGWISAQQIARDWSMTAPGRYKQESFDKLVRDFDPLEGITLGTLYYHAKTAGWKASTPTHTGDISTLNLRALPLDPGAGRFLKAAEVKAHPISGYRVRGLLPSEGIAAVYGPSGSGKSFLIADLCFGIAAGLPEWFGRKIKQAPVVYVALEGSAGLRNRISALETHYKMPIPDCFRFVMGGFTLQNTAQIEVFADQAAETLGLGVVVVIDTLNQASPGADENSSQDMGAIIAAAKLLGERLQGLVVLVHHTGKDTSRGLRGHSSLGAALDAAIEVEIKGGLRSWSATKVKDDDLGGRHAFALKPYVVGADEDGLEVTSCAIDRALLPEPSQRNLTGKLQKVAMNAIKDLLNSEDTPLTESRAIEVIAKNLDVDPGRRFTRAKEQLAALVHSGRLFLDEGVITLT